MTLKVVSLFSGAGGMDLGFIKAGFNVIWANDIDKDSCETYKNNINNEIICDDINNIKYNLIPDCDIVIGGFPCQGFSVANLNRTVSDERNTLYKAFLNVVKEKKPNCFIAENVRGILSLGKGAVIKKIVKDFTDINYTVDYYVVNASDYEVPQNRIRVFIVGIYKNQERVSFTLKDRLTSDDSKKISISEALENIPEPDSEHNLLNHIGSKYKVTSRNFTGHRLTNPNKPSPTILARGNGKGGVCALQHPLNHRRMTIREQAILQTFPLDFKFYGGMGSCYRQVGNAVPVKLAYFIAKSISYSNKLKVISLFSGAGGFDYGFKKNGHEIVWANDIFSDAVKTYKKNIGKHIIEDDIKNIDIKNIPDADLVIGGFPCQGFSVANMNRKSSDPRNKLYLYFLEVLKVKKPMFFLAENVRGILNLEKGKVFEKIINDFESCGYNIQYNLLNAADYGIPQNRYRVFIFGTKKGYNSNISFPPQMTHSSKNIRELKEYVSISEAIRRFPDPDKNHNIKNHVYSKFKMKFNGFINHRIVDPNKVAPTVTARGDMKGGAMINYHPNNLRRMTVREVAAIQTFPDDFEFCGNMTSCYMQVGNAVPPLLSEKISLIFENIEIEKLGKEVKSRSKNNSKEIIQLELSI